MNLIQDTWLPFRLRDGSVEELPIADIVRSDVVDLALPRADFQGAAYQLLIGLLQTVMAPDNRRQWHKLFNEPPTSEELQAQLKKVAHAFNLTGDGPLFMQDFDELEDAEISEINGLFIDGPGANGIKKNTDHFVKRSEVVSVSLPVAALALFTWQVNGVAFGSGYRVGLRGGGPLTVLLTPQDVTSTLWQKIWLNVINRKFWVYDEPDFNSANVFPWLGHTKSSDKANSEIYPSEAHQLTVFWAMPNRLRLIAKEEKMQCDITGKESLLSVKHFKKKNYGNQYPSELWRHPLTAYWYDPQKSESDKITIKPQSDGIAYRVWDNLVLSSDSYGQLCAKNVEHYSDDIASRKSGDFNEIPNLWCFGFNMKNREALCWYSSLLPMFNLSKESQPDILRAIKELQELTNKFRLELNKRVKEAWFDRPKDAKGDTTFIAAQFWQKTENTFFEAVQALSQQEHYYPLNTQAAQAWLKSMQNTVLALFDEYTLSVDIGDPKQLKRIMQARRFLSIWLYAGKDVKDFKKQHGISDIKEVA